MALCDMTPGNRRISIVVLVAVGIIVPVGMLLEREHQQSPEQQAEAARQELELSARGACETFVRRRLRAPSTAKFASKYESDPFDRPRVHLRSDSAVEVQSWVDAENGFGAKIRTSFTCTVRRSGSDMVLMDLAIDQ